MNKSVSTLVSSISNILTDAINGKFSLKYSTLNESNLIDEGFSFKLGESPRYISTPKEKAIVTLSPRASILVKKKAFSTFKSVNDLQWLDKTEKMLLRATKTLFAYKVAQIRAYENLTRFEEYFKDTAEINLTLLAELLENSKVLTNDTETAYNDGLFKNLVNIVSASISDVRYDKVKEDVLLLLERNSFSSELSLTTWIVDPNNVTNYETGPGTGVIEVGIFSGFNTGCSLNSDPSSASFSLEDPYRVMNITEGDIEFAIEEALVGTIGLLSSLSNPSSPPIDARSILGAGLEMIGLGSLDDTIDVDYIRERLRIFYLGKPFINAGDGVHFYIRGNKTVQYFNEESSIYDQSFYAIDESILEAERILFTSGSIDLETYKNLRQFSDNSFGMNHVFGGFVKNVDQTWNSGKWNLTVNCVDNMEWLRWSRFMIEPSLQDPSGILEDPLTPYEIKTDSAGRVLAAQGPQLLEENKALIRSGLLYYDSGLLNGQVATENNLLQGQYNKSGSLSGTKILQHPHGLIYRWKKGIISATTAGINLTDPLNESQVTQKIHNQVYGVTVAQDALNNLDIANILSLLIVGQPYNVETFIKQAQQAMNFNPQSSVSSVGSIDPLSAILDVVRRQNNHFGNFRPYRMITLSSQTLLQSAQSNILRNQTNKRISELQIRRAELDSLIRKLEGTNSGLPITGTMFLNSLKEERRNIENGINEQLNLLSSSGTVSSTDIITENFNLFGKSRTLPLTGNYTADHQISRSMSIVGAQRKIEDVRLNRDHNLFIVSDQYDEQTDIRPFILNIQNADFKIFKGAFVNVHTKCVKASKFINLEFFTNTQGHLEFRPPQWNKTPLSILERIFELGKNSNKNIIPEFLYSIFQSRSSSLRREIHSLNIRIVLLALLMNKYPDKTLIPNFSSLVGSFIIPDASENSNKILRFFGVKEIVPGDAGFVDLRDRKFQFSVGSILDTGNQILGTGLNLLGGNGEDGNILDGDTETLLGIFDPAFQESINLTNNILTTASSPTGSNANKLATASNLNDLREAFVKISGLDPASDLVTTNGKFSNDDFITSKSKSPEAGIAKANNYLKKLQEAISQRDNLVTILKRNKEKEEELENIENILSGQFLDEPQDVNTGILQGVINTIKTISDIFTGDSSKGTLFDHLISDDTRNLNGPGSGRRFIINDEDVIQASFTEQPPDFCRVNVIGDAPIISGLSGPFEERYFWAGATDFDLWRQYGFQDGGSLSLPFASDPETTCRPYAMFELQLQRVKINQASLTVVGNEYYEPGDTIYLPMKELLYYVRSVNHNFDWGGNFTTSLTLEFGHPPGIYLPSPLDIIGQQYTKDPLTGTQLTYRNMRGDDSYQVLQPDSAIIFPANQSITIEQIPVLLDHKNNAVRFTNMMAELSSLIIGDRVVLIRGFVKNRSIEDEERVKNNILIIKHLLQNPVSLTQTNPTSAIDDIFDIGSSIARGIGKSSGTTKGTTSMKLPNGLIVMPIAANKIAEQIVYLDQDSTTSNILAVDSKIKTAQILDTKLVDTKEFDAVFPKGGPKQRSWLDIRDENGITGLGPSPNVSNIIEIGILDLNRTVATGIKKVNDKEKGLLNINA